MTGKLKIVATPIGNIKDITLRAIEEIKNADLILAEDTRQSEKLINLLGIKLKEGSKIISCFAQNEAKRINLALERLTSNSNIVLLTDAGCPSISDPGGKITQAIISEGFDIEVIPGASALTTSLMGSGLSISKFIFLGFLPKKSTARIKLLSQYRPLGVSLVIFESPLRVQTLLQELFKIFGPQKVVIARELTKMHETFHRGLLGAPLNPPFVEKGECVVILELASINNIEANEINQNEIASFIEIKKNENKTNKEIVSLLVKNFGMKKNAAYDLVIKKN